jgi:hypothetical protein
LYFFIGIPAPLQSEFSLTPAGTKNPGQVNKIFTSPTRPAEDRSSKTGLPSSAR